MDTQSFSPPPPPPAPVMVPKTNYLLLMVGVVVTAVIFGLGGYYLGTMSTPAQDVAIVEPLLMEEEEIVAVDDTEVEWPAYTNTDPAYTIQHPSDWIVNATPLGPDFPQLKMSKDAYVLTISWPTAYGPSACFFEDQPEFDTFGTEPKPQQGLCPGEFKEFVGTSGQVFRRLVSPSIKNPETGTAGPYWTVYAKEANAPYFVTVPPISFTAPVDYDPAEIEVMDAILASYKAN